MITPVAVLRRLNPLGSGAAQSPLTPILERYAWTVPVVGVLSLLASTLEGLGIGLLIPLLTTLLASEGLASGTGPLAALGRFAALFEPDIRLVAMAAAIFSLVALKAIVQVANWTFISWIDGRASHDIRQGLSHRLLDFGYPFFLSEDPARLLNIVSTEAWRASEAIRAAFSMAVALAAAIVFAVLLALVSWKLFLFVVAGVALIRVGQTAFARRLRLLSDRVAQTNLVLADRMLMIIEAMRLIRIFGQQEKELRRFGDASERVRRAHLAVDSASASLTPVLEVLHAGLFMAVLIAANAMGMDVPMIVTFLVLLYRMQPHLIALNRGRLNLAALRGSVREVEWLLDPAGKHPPPVGRIPFRGLDGPIVFEGVSFVYPNRPEAGPALEEVSFTLHRRRATALIGRSGSGKTTIVNMLLRLLEPTSGRITVGGVNLAEIDPASWRARIGLAGQDIDLAEGTIAQNIAYGAPDATFEEIVQAARLADADGFIRALPKGYDTAVGSRGISLSGGQRQRIGIARALVRKPEILILDEATNAVDGISERAILSLLRERARDKTTIVVSHRQSTLDCCEDGIVLDEGRVSESGPLRSLAFYQRMSPVSEGSGG